MSKKVLKKSIAGGLILASLGTVIPAPTPVSPILTLSQVQAQEAGVVRWATSAEIPTTDSAKTYDTVSFTAVSQIGEGLLKVGNDGSVVPAGASDLPEVNDDETEYTFKLREDAKWSNGDPVTAHDYVYAWQRAVDPDTGSANAFVFDGVKNAKQIGQGEADIEELGVEAVNDHELKVTLDQPLPNFLRLVTGVNFYPQNQAFVEEKGEAYGTSSDNVLGNGPFTIENWDASSLSWSYKKNPEYYGAKDIQINQIDVEVVKDPNTAVNLLEAGELDLAPISGNLLAQYQGDERLISVPGVSHTYIEFGTSSNEDLQSENLRHALSLVINRQELSDNVLFGGAKPVKGIVPENVAFDPESGKDFTEGSKDYSTFDVEQAKEYWEKAKEELGKDKVEFELLVTDSEISKRIGEYVQGQIQNNLEGVTINLKPLPAKARFEQMMSFDYDIAVGGWSASNGDAAEYLVNFVTDATHNHPRFSDEAFDKLIEEAQGDLVKDSAKREEKLHEAENYLLDHQVFIPLIQANENILISDRINNIEITPDGYGVDFTTLSLNE